MSLLIQAGIFLVSFTVINLLFIFIPFKISLPDEIYNLFIDGTINDIFKSISYLVPVNFMIGCLIIILTSRYFGLIFGVINWIWRKIFT